MPIKIENVDLYSVSEVSQMLNVTTRNYIKQGSLKGQKIMGRWVVLEEELSNFLRNSNAI